MCDFSFAFARSGQNNPYQSISPNPSAIKPEPRGKHNIIRNRTLNIPLSTFNSPTLFTDQTPSPYHLPMYGGSLVQQPLEYRNPQGTPSPQPPNTNMSSFSPQPQHFPTPQNLNLPIGSAFGAPVSPFNGNNLPSYDPTNSFVPYSNTTSMLPPGMSFSALASASGMDISGGMPPLPSAFTSNTNDLSLDLNSSEMRQLLSTELGNRDIDDKLSDSLSRLLNNNN